MSRKSNHKVKHVSKLPVLKYSGFSPKVGDIEIAKKHNYCVIKDVSVTGDAPKDVIRYYEYGHSLKVKTKKWPIYIAKLGHKYYPLESITEQLISDIGKWYGFNLADSKICSLGGQIRFLSRYFLKKHTDELYHGADMYAGYLNDKQFVDDIELQRMTQAFFTISFTRDVFSHFFKDSFNEVFKSFMLMLFFDALIGNNDRHMYNWGIIRDVYGRKLAEFSPIYDSARGLLWNETEDKINEISKSTDRKKQFVKKYCNNSKPKIGIENEENVNHFKLIKSYDTYFKNTEFIQRVFADNKIEEVIENLNLEYRTLISSNRRSIITDILGYRFQELKKIIT